MKKEDMSPTQDFLIGTFADRIGRSLAKEDIIRIGVIEEGDELGVEFSKAGFRKAKAALKRRKLPPGVRAEFDADERLLFLIPEGLGIA